MKKTLILIIFEILFTSCSDDPKFTVLKVKDAKKGYELHWYYYSYLTSLSPDHVDLVNSNGDEFLIFKGLQMTDVKFKSNDTIEIEINKECDSCIMDIKNKVEGYIVITKQTGKWDNLGERRRERERFHQDSLKNGLLDSIPDSKSE
ncbi:MAG: hypothetical protein ACKOXB_15025 [Flavobacteriales bacterium]